MIKHFLVFIAGMALATPTNLMAKDSKFLRFTVSTSWGMPYGEFENEHMTGGLVYDLAHAISEKHKLTPEFILLPRNRVDDGAKNHEYDVRCYVTPEWIKDQSIYSWGEPLFEISDVVVGSLNIQKINTLADLKGKRIGTVLGYIYPSLEKQFNDGSVEREDAENQKSVLQKLARGRTGYAITNSFAFEYFLKSSKEKNQFANWQMKISSSKFYCAILKSDTINAKGLINTIRKLKKDGTLERILNKYR